jgi:hypothetical protein
MKTGEKPIYFTHHALEQMKERQATENEVIETIRNSKWVSAEKGRLTASKLFPFQREHYGRYYASKEVVPVFTEEIERIVVITVYTFFSQRR